MVLLDETVPPLVEVVMARLQHQEKLQSPCCQPKCVANPQKGVGWQANHGEADSEVDRITLIATQHLDSFEESVQ